MKKSLLVFSLILLNGLELLAQSPRLLIGDNDHNQIVMCKPDGSDLDTLDFDGMNFSFYDADINPVNHRIYMAWYYGIYSMNYDGSDLDTLFPYTAGNYSRGIAVDPVNGFLYWSSSPDGEIYKSNLTATSIDTIYTTTGYLGDLDLDLLNNKLYFGQWNTAENGLFRIETDGSGVDTIVHDSDTEYLGLDMMHEVIYFGDGLTCRKVNYDHSDNIYLFSFYPGGFWVGTLNSILYSSSITGNNVQVSALDGTVASDLFAAGTLNAPFGPVLVPYTLAEIETMSENSSKLVIYPNPAKDQVTITGFEQASTILIYNVFGELMLTTKGVGMIQLDSSALPAGTYMVISECNDSRSYSRVVVLH